MTYITPSLFQVELVDPETDAWRVVQDAKPIDPNDPNVEFLHQVTTNTDYINHPEEIAAGLPVTTCDSVDNFALLALLHSGECKKVVAEQGIVLLHKMAQALNVELKPQAERPVVETKTKATKRVKRGE